MYLVLSLFKTKPSFNKAVMNLFYEYSSYINELKFFYNYKQCNLAVSIFKQINSSIEILIPQFR